MKTTLEIINETVEEYRDSSKRAMKTIESERYQPIVCVYEAANGNQCAFGRCCPEPAKLPQCSVDDLEDYDINYNDVLKPEYQGHSLEFWRDVQTLHDLHEHFANGTYSEKGSEYIEWLKKKYS